MALVSIAAVGVMGLSAYGVWRHRQVVESEEPAALADDQKIAGRKEVLSVFGNEPSLVPLIGQDALTFLAKVNWVNLKTSQDTTAIEYAGGTISRADLSQKTFTRVMKDVNVNAKATDQKPPFDFDKPLPPQVG
jgi:hypothetical protein